LKDYKVGVRNLTQIVLGANSLIQGAIPRLLTPTPGSKDALALEEFSKHYMDTLRRNTKVCVEEAADCPEISVIEPQGAMYMMIKIEIEKLEGIKDDAHFAQMLLQEENLILLPGQCFTMKNFIRLVIAPPDDYIREALIRIKLFCARHRKTNTASTTEESKEPPVQSPNGKHKAEEKKEGAANGSKGMKKRKT
jgi:tyrosine aminotransferase